MSEKCMHCSDPIRQREDGDWEHAKDRSTNCFFASHSPKAFPKQTPAPSTPTPSDEVEKKLAEELGYSLDWVHRYNSNPLWRALVSERRKSAEVRAQAMEEAAKIAEVWSTWNKAGEAPLSNLAKELRQRKG
jgi:hypothetical protein